MKKLDRLITRVLAFILFLLAAVHHDDVRLMVQCLIAAGVWELVGRSHESCD